MKHYFPAVNRLYKYLQTNRSNVLGNLWATFGIDFQSNLGVIRAGKKLAIVTDSSDDADLGTPSAFEYFADRWWATCGTRIFKNGSEEVTSGFSEDASTDVPTDFDPDASDLAVFNGRLWATTADELLSKATNTGSWTSRDNLGGGMHGLKYFTKTGRLYFGDADDTISSTNTSDVLANSAGDYFLDLDLSSEEITCFDVTTDYIFIGTRVKTNSSAGHKINGSIYMWDGVSSQVSARFPLTSAGCLAIKVHDNIPYAIDAHARVLKFVGTGFDEVARFPLGTALLNNATVSGSFLNFVHYNGVEATKNNTLLININNLNDDSGNTVQENLPSGVWELDLATGSLTHKHPYTLKGRGSSTITDFGQNRLQSVGAIKVNHLTSDSSSGRSEVVAGATIYTDASSVKSAIFVENNQSTEGQKRAYFVTTWFDADEIEDIWQRLWVIYRRFLNSTDKMVFKYRLTEEDPVEATITWVNTTSFTTTTDVSAYDDDATGFDGAYGGEVEILQGTGAGACVHITNVSESGGTYTVTVDNAVTGVTTGTAKARFQKWIKLLPEVTGQVKSYESFPIVKNATRIQIKGCMEFTGDNEFTKFILISDPHIPAIE